MEVLRDVVVWFDLRRIQIVFETQRLDEGARHGWPVGSRIGCNVRIEIADRPVEFAEDLHGSKRVALSFETLGYIREFFPHGSGGGGLWCGHSSANGEVAFAVSDDRARQVTAAVPGGRASFSVNAARLLMSSGGTREVDELDAARFATRKPYEVFDRLHVVVGRALDLFDAGAVALSRRRQPESTCVQ